MKVAGLGVVAQIDPVAVVADDVLGAGVLIGAATHQLLHAEVITHHVACLNNLNNV